MSVFVFVLGIIALTIVAPLWIVFHYLTLWRSQRGLSPDDERMLGDLWASAKRLEARIANLERIVHDETGQPLTTSFMDYPLMTAADMPPLVKVHMETPSPTNALGAKGAGEGGTIPAAAAVVSAIEHALGDLPTPITHYPVSSQWVHSALQTRVAAP